MSWVRVPDMHPGRCENLRLVQRLDGQVEYLRCLDYEGTEHVCTFPQRSVPAFSAQSLNTLPPRKPKRWVKPEAVS